ncbi:hypothetical protein ACLKA7_000209 [Drosophila subpalustris]
MANTRGPMQLRGRLLTSVIRSITTRQMSTVAATFEVEPTTSNFVHYMMASRENWDTVEKVACETMLELRREERTRAEASR